MKINVKGTIVSNDDAWIYELFDIQHTNPSAVLDALAEADGEDIDVDINSGGGDVFAGSEIYSALRAYHGKVNIHVVGFCASAASVIAMAGYSDISPTAQMMVHNVSMWESGDYHAHDKASEILQTANRSIAAAYVEKSGMEEKEALKLMDRETWLTAQEAVDYGLIDKIAEPNQTNATLQLVASYGAMILPAKILNEYRTRKIELQNKLDELKNMEV